MTNRDLIEALREFETTNIKRQPDSFWIGYINSFTASYLSDNGRHELIRRLIEHDSNSNCCDAPIIMGDICSSCKEHTSSKWED